MPAVDRIEVCIVTNGRPLTEYSEPDNPRHVHRYLDRYVPMQAGQKFGIMLELREKFKLLEAEHIHWLFTDILQRKT